MQGTELENDGVTISSATCSDYRQAVSHSPIESNWPSSNAKRAFDVSVAAAALGLLSPVILLTGLAVRLSSTGPALFRQLRVGKDGRTFLIWKFRTMRMDLAAGPCVTKAGDERLTPIGGFLRRFKLDELPQLANVLKGEMSLVGPRPMVPHHQTSLLRTRPGITGAASLAFRNEEELLLRIPEDLLDEYQLNVLMPMKRKLDEEYSREATLLTDLRLLFYTVISKGDAINENDLRKFQASLISLGSALSMQPNAILGDSANPLAVQSKVARVVSNSERS